MNWIKSNVVMLPTEKATILYKFEETNKLIFSNHPNQHELATPQHLYFTSNEMIKKGFSGFAIVTVKDDARIKYLVEVIVTEDNQCYCKEDRKFSFKYYQINPVIATTDKSLGLPEPSKGFIKVYVKAPNEGKKIEEVLIQCNEKGLSLHDRGGERTITIKKVKDSWSRAEVIEFAKLALQTNGSLSTSAGFEWIERNL